MFGTTILFCLSLIDHHTESMSDVTGMKYPLQCCMAVIRLIYARLVELICLLHRRVEEAVF